MPKSTSAVMHAIYVKRKQQSVKRGMDTVWQQQLTL